MCRPAGGHFTVEFAGNKGLTTLSHDGKFAKAFGDGKDHPEGLGLDGKWSVVHLIVCQSWPDCSFIASAHRTYMQRTNLVHIHPLLCVEERLVTILPDASGYAFAISYQSDISKVTLENLVIFTTKFQYALTPLFPISH